MASTIKLTLPTQISALRQMEEAVEAFGAQEDWPPRLAFQMQLVLEELASNVIRHGFGEEGHEFEISVSSDPDAVTVEVVDAAAPYNPITETPEPDLDAELEDRQIGGLGVFLVRDVADEMSYRREDGKNRLVIVKRRD